MASAAGTVDVPTLSFGLSISNVSFALAIAVLTVRLVARRTLPPHLDAGVALGVAWLVLSMPGVFLSLDPLVAVRVGAWVPFYCGVAFATYEAVLSLGAVRILTLLWLSAVGYCAWGLVVLVAYQLGYDLGQYTANGGAIVRLTSLSQEANLFASYLSVIVPLGVVLALETRRRIFLLTAGIVLIAALLTFSRGLWIALLLMLVAYVQLTQNKSRTAVRIATAAILGALVATLFFSGSPALLAFFAERVTTLSDMLYLRPDSRIGVLIAGLQEMTRTPANVLFGIGQGDIVRSLDTYGLGAFVDLRDRGELLHLHNLYAEVLVSNGVLSFAAFLGLVAHEFVYSLRRLRRASPHSRPLVLAGILSLVGILGMGLSFEVLISPFLFVAFALNRGIAASSVNATRRTSPD